MCMLFSTREVEAQNGVVSEFQIKTRIREIMDAEDGGSPYSDSQISGLLKNEGIPISREGVKKYRIEMGIGNSYERREK